MSVDNTKITRKFEQLMSELMKLKADVNKARDENRTEAEKLNTISHDIHAEIAVSKRASKAAKHPRTKRVTNTKLREEFNQLKASRDKEGANFTKDYAAEVLANKFGLKYSYVRNLLKKL